MSQDILDSLEVERLARTITTRPQLEQVVAAVPDPVKRAAVRRLLTPLVAFQEEF